MGVVRLERYGIGPVITVGLKLIEYSIFAVDLILFEVFLYRTAKRTIKHL